MLPVVHILLIFPFFSRGCDDPGYFLTTYSIHFSSPNPMHQKSKTWLGSNQRRSTLWVQGTALPDECALLLFPVLGVLQAAPIRSRQCWWSCVTLWWAPVCSQGMFPLPFPWAGVLGAPSSPWLSTRNVFFPLSFLWPWVTPLCCLFLLFLPLFCLIFPLKEASELFAPVCAGRLLLTDYWHSSLGYFPGRECGVFSANDRTRVNPMGSNNLSDLVPEPCTLFQVSS